MTTNFKVLIVGILSGVIFGLALYKSFVFQPDFIRNQMMMKNFTMMRVFLTALATSTIMFTVMKLSGIYTSHNVHPAWKRNAIGGFILGSGNINPFFYKIDKLQQCTLVEAVSSHLFICNINTHEIRPRDSFCTNWGRNISIIFCFHWRTSWGIVLWIPRISNYLLVI
jgi:hypothetical protein